MSKKASKLPLTSQRRPSRRRMEERANEIVEKFLKKGDLPSHDLQKRERKESNKRWEETPWIAKFSKQKTENKSSSRP